MKRKPKADKINGGSSMVTELSNPPLPTGESNEKLELQKSSEALPTVKRLHEDKRLIVRRSNRLRSADRPVQGREIQISEKINLIENEGEGEPFVEEPSHETMHNERSLEEKVDYLIQVVEELRSKGLERQFPNETTPDDQSYKSLFSDSLKKIEALNSELSQCNKKLEFALGKLDAYESMKDLMEKLKEVILISNLGKATETVVSLSSQLTCSGGCRKDVGPAETMAAQSPTKKKKCGNKD